MLQEVTEEKSFADTVIPLVIMAVDLTDRDRDSACATARCGRRCSRPWPWPACSRRRSATATAWSMRIALVPVPTASVVDGGADLVVSVNLMSAETLDRWPAGPEIPPPPEKKRRGALDTMLEVMDLSQLDTSTRLAALADVSSRRSSGRPTGATSTWPTCSSRPAARRRSSSCLPCRR